MDYLEEIKRRLASAQHDTDGLGRKTPDEMGRYIAGCGGTVDQRINAAAIVAEVLGLRGDAHERFADGLAEALAPALRTEVRRLTQKAKA